MIEQRAIAIRGGFQLLQEISKLFHVEAVDLSYFLDFFLIALVVRQPVVGFGNADLGICARALLKS